MEVLFLKAWLFCEPGGGILAAVYLSAADMRARFIGGVWNGATSLIFISSPASAWELFVRLDIAFAICDEDHSIDLWFRGG